MRDRTGWTGLALLGAALGCASASPHASEPPPLRALERPALELGSDGLPDRDFAGGVRVLADAGWVAASSPCRLLRWNAGAPPRWAPIDAWVREVQRSGIEDLELCIDLRRSPSRARAARVPPPPAHEEFAAWVARVVERFDGDGNDDAEDVLEPIRRFRLAPGIAALEAFEDVEPLLAQLRNAMHEASAKARLASPTLRARGTPSEELGRRIAVLAAAPQPFDAWSVEASGSADELDAWLAWLAPRRAALPIQIVAGSARPLAEGGAPARCDAAGPERALLDPAIAESLRCTLAERFGALLAGDPEAQAWARAAVSRDAVQKAVVAASWGVGRVQLARFADSRWWSDPALDAAAGLAAWSGLLERGSARAYPAFFALRQLHALLDGREMIARLDAGDPAIHLYALDGDEGVLWIGWYEPRPIRGADDAVPLAEVEIEFGARRAQLLHAPSALGRAASERVVRESREGKLRVELSPTPLFVLPD